MAHKATLPHPFVFHHRPAKPVSEADRLFRGRLMVALGVAVAMAGLVFAAPLLLGTAVAAGIFDGWDSPIDYD